MSYHKIEVKESEKTPKVLMNNWSLDVLLGKEVGRLGKSERTVLNRCTMEQKILHKRYKKMMHQSKLTHARITSNHELEKELRSQTSMRFNTNLGADDNDEMLRRTWDYGRRKRSVCMNAQSATSSTASLSSASSKPARARSAPAKTAAYRTKVKKGKGAGKDIAEEPLSQDSGISLDGLEPVLDEDLEVFERSVSVQRASVSQRPATAIGTHRTSVHSSSTRQPSVRSQPSIEEKDPISRVASANVSVGHPNPRVRKSAAIEVPKIAIRGAVATVVELERATEKHEDDVSLATKTQPEDSPTQDAKQSTTHEPSGQFLQTYLAETEPSPKPSKPKSRPASCKSSKSSSTTEATNFKEFCSAVVSKEPGGRPNLLDIQKVRVRVADYDTKVKAFNNSIAHLKAPKSAVTDYYTTRMMDRPVKQYAPRKVSPTESEIRREMGNPNLASMTFKTVNKTYT